MLLLNALIFGGCGPTAVETSKVAIPAPVEPDAPYTDQLTVIPATTPTEVVGAVDAQAARDSALAYVAEHYGDQAPAPGLPWTEERSTPEVWVGAGTYRYTAKDWVVIISYQFLDPKPVVYEVVVANQATRFYWQGEVDAAGQVIEKVAHTGG